MSDDAAVHLYRAFVTRNPADAIAVIQRAKREGVPQASLLDQLYAPAMSLLGGAWASGIIDEYVFTRAAVVAEQARSFIVPPTPVPAPELTILAGHDAPRPAHDRQGDHRRRASRGRLQRGRPGHRRPPLRVPRACRGDGRPHARSSSPQQLATARSVVRVREMFVAGGRGDALVFVSGGPFAADAELARAVGANGVLRGAESALELVAEAACAGPRGER